MPKGWKSNTSSSNAKIITITSNKQNDKYLFDQGNTEKRKALIIGISDYNDKNLPELAFCKNDGEKMYLLMKGLNYEIPDNFKLIGNVNYNTMRRAIIDFFRDKNIKPKDTLLFYYSGHGVPDGTGNTYLSSSEIEASDPYPYGVSFADITLMISQSVSKRIITIMDCCYSGSLQLENASFNTQEKKERY